MFSGGPRLGTCLRTIGTASRHVLPQNKKGWVTAVLVVREAMRGVGYYELAPLDSARIAERKPPLILGWSLAWQNLRRIYAFLCDLANVIRDLKSQFGSIAIDPCAPLSPRKVRKNAFIGRCYFMSSELAYLGVLAAPTLQGKRAIAISLTGNVQSHHIVRANLDYGDESVTDWLWNAGINPREAAEAPPAEYFMSYVLLPELADSTLVVTYQDMDIPMVDALVRTLGRQGTPAIVSGVQLANPTTKCVVNGEAGSRADALQAAYEAALEGSRTVPAVHRLAGEMDCDGQLKSISVDGPFRKGAWAISEPCDALFIAMSLASLTKSAELIIEDGPAADALSSLAAQVGLVQG